MAPSCRRVTVAEEFEKNPDLNREDLNALRQWLKAMPHLPEISDEMLILFHHSCYFDLANTRKCIEAYFKSRSSMPEVFSNRDLTKMPLAQNKSSVNISVLPDTVNGNRLLYYSMRESEPSKYNMYDHMKIFLMAIDAIYVQHGTQPGLVIVFNMDGVSLGHLTRISLFGFKKFFQYIQEGIPIRLKKIHLINVVPFIDKFMTLLKPFMNKKFYNLINFHTTDMDAFYEEVPRKCLPKEVGGSLESAEVFTDKTMQLLTEFVDFFAQEEKLRINESKRDNRKNSKQNKSDVEIPFGRLEID